MKIKSISYAGKADVFNMEVDETHSFVIQGGVIAHNCGDEWRYMCMTRPVKAIIKINVLLRMGDDPLNQIRDYNAAVRGRR